MTEPKRPNSKTPPWDQAHDQQGGSFGGWLRRQREIREIALREIAESSKVSLRYLEAFEQDRFDVLPAPVFAKGFLREYAKYVGLDPDEVVNYFLSAQEALQPEEDPELPPPQVQSSTHWTYGLFLSGAVVALLGVVAILSFWAERRHKTFEQTLPAIAAPPPVVSEVVPTEPPPTPGAPLRLTLEFTQNCWVEALIDGQRRISELRVQGESLQIEAEESLRLTLGNAGGARAELNGIPFDLNARAGQVVRDLLIDLETLRALSGEPQ